AHIELGMVEQIEELGLELETHAFAERERKVFDHGEIRVHEPWTIDRSTGCDTEFPSGRLHKRTRVKPVLNCVDLTGRGATGIACDRPRLIWITDLIGTLVRASVVGEEHSRPIATIHDEQGESRRGVHN